MSMWEDFIKCFRKGTKIKGCSADKIAELFQRVPPGQRKNLIEFSNKHNEYVDRVRKYPDKMPTIDWKYYKTNVRKEMVDWVTDFEKKYDNVDSMFSNRHSMIDFSKYFGELEKQTEEVKLEVKKFKEASNERIKLLQLKMDELKCMKPYSEMTMEEFCFAHPNEAPDFINKPTFWPHTVEENLPNVEHVHEEEAKKEPQKDKSDPKKPPPTDAPAGSEKPNKGKEVDSKKPADSPKEPEKGKVQAVQVEPKESTESQITEKVTELASKGIELVKELGSKAIVVLQNLWEKWEAKRRQVAKDAEAERKKKESANAVKTLDGKAVRDVASPEICNKTIIRGEEMAKADVKEQHVDLTIEGETDPDEQISKQKTREAKGKGTVCKEEGETVCSQKCQDKNEEIETICQKYEEKKSKEDADNICQKYEEKKKTEDVDSVCYQKYQEKKKASRLSAEEEKSCKEAATQDDAKLLAKQSEDECKKPKKEENKCKPDEKASLDTTLKPAANAEQPTSVVNASTPTSGDDNTIIGMHHECLTAENEIFLGSKRPTKIDTEQNKVEAFDKNKVQASDGKKIEISDHKTEPAVQPKQVSQNEIIAAALEKQLFKTKSSTVPKSELSDEGSNEFKSSSDAKQLGKQQKAQGDPEEIAKNMFKMATGAAQLLSDAKRSIEQVHRENAGQIEVLQHAYETAEKQINLALSQAYSALASAKKLAHRAQSTLEADEQKLVATIEKHSMLAKLLANQAVTMQKEISKLLAGLNKKQ
ncbi:DNA ligase 1 [Drosophila albomicans]|uniref:DNA ligase 1 n=1 Tax=Drosophila albomicans TaxID=7291 RepID=A0A6P8WHH4_DROAB|nr:DNA ligase 1 [Drosophila albomicans]